MKEITLSTQEIETLIYGCMSAIDSYCINDDERKPYQEMIRRLEALKHTDKKQSERRCSNV